MLLYVKLGEANGRLSVSDKKTVESKQVLRAFVVYSLFKASVNDEACFARLDLNT